MNRWVYRRPFFRAAKPKIPLVRPVGGLFVRRIRRLFRRRRHIIGTRAAIIVKIPAKQAGAQAVIVRRRVQLRAPQRIGPANKIILPRFTGAHKQIIPHRRVRIRPPQRIGIKHKIPLPKTPTPTFGGPIKRFMRTIMRMREAMRRRLLFRPREIPPIAAQPPVHAPPRGEINAAGAVEGSVFSAGSKRGWIDG